jgi:hypothetical protein
MTGRVAKPLLLGGVGAVLVTIAISFALVEVHSANQLKACNQEYQYVQAALLAYMSNQSLTIVPASSGTNNMSAPVPLYDKAGTVSNPSLVRDPQTQWSYAWDGTGVITAIRTGPGGPVPAGCRVSAN